MAPAPLRDLADRPDRRCLNTATLGYREPIAVTAQRAAAAGFGWITPWRREIDEGRPARDAEAIRAAGLRVRSYCRTSYLAHDSEAREAAGDRRQPPGARRGRGPGRARAHRGGRRPGGGIARHRRLPRPDPAGARGPDAGDRVDRRHDRAGAAAPVLRGRPLACSTRSPRPRPGARRSIARGGTSASPSTPTTSGGIPSWRRRSPAPVPGSGRSTSPTGCGTPRSRCSTGG